MRQIPQLALIWLITPGWHMDTLTAPPQLPGITPSPLAPLHHLVVVSRCRHRCGELRFWKAIKGLGGPRRGMCRYHEL